MYYLRILTGNPMPEGGSCYVEFVFYDGDEKKLMYHIKKALSEGYDIHIIQEESDCAGGE